MKTPSWKQIRQGLRERDPTGDMPPAEAFWLDFKARAALRRQEQAGPAPGSRVLRWAWAPACALALAAVIAIPMLRGTNAYAGMSRIDSYEVSVGHSAVLILEDQASESIMLWVVDMEPTTNNETL